MVLCISGPFSGDSQLPNFSRILPTLSSTSTPQQANNSHSTQPISNRQAFPVKDQSFGHLFLPSHRPTDLGKEATVRLGQAYPAREPNEPISIPMSVAPPADPPVVRVTSDGRKIEKKPVKFSNLLLGAGLNMFEVTTLGQPLEVMKTTMAANRKDGMAGAIARIWGRGGVLGCKF